MAVTIVPCARGTLIENNSAQRKERFFNCITCAQGTMVTLKDTLRRITFLKPVIEKDFDYAKCAVSEDFSDYSDVKFKFQIFLKAEYCFANFDFELFNAILKNTGDAYYTVRNSTNGLGTNQKKLEKSDNLSGLIKTALKVNLNE